MTMPCTSPRECPTARLPNRPTRRRWSTNLHPAPASALRTSAQANRPAPSRRRRQIEMSLSQNSPAPAEGQYRCLSSDPFTTFRQHALLSETYSPTVDFARQIHLHSSTSTPPLTPPLD